MGLGNSQWTREPELGELICIYVLKVIYLAGARSIRPKKETAKALKESEKKTRLRKGKCMQTQPIRDRTKSKLRFTFHVSVENAYVEMRPKGAGLLRM